MFDVESDDPTDPRRVEVLQRSKLAQHFQKALRVLDVERAKAVLQTTYQRSAENLRAAEQLTEAVRFFEAVLAPLMEPVQR